MKNLLYLQAGRFALEINAYDKVTVKDSFRIVADVIISYRSPVNDDWIELIRYIVHCGSPWHAGNERMLAESIIKCSTQATADMLEDLSALGKIFAEKMGELNERLNDAEG